MSSLSWFVLVFVVDNYETLLSWGKAGLTHDNSSGEKRFNQTLRRAAPIAIITSRLRPCTAFMMRRAQSDGSISIARKGSNLL